MKRLVLVLVMVMVLCFGSYVQRYSQLMVTPSISAAFDTSQSRSHAFYISAISVNTNVIYEIDGSADGLNWSNIDDLGTTQTITTASTQMLHKDDFSTALMRVKWVSSSGTGFATQNLLINYVGDGTK